MSAVAIIILCYLALVPLLGILLTRKLHLASAWATAGGGMGITLIAAGVAGTRIGGAGTYGVAGETMRTGIWNLWYGITTFLALALVGLFFTRPYRRLQLTTIGELFAQRYGTTRCGWLTSLCVQSEYFVVNIIEPLLIGVIVSQVVRVDLFVGIAIGATAIILATSLSGLRGTSLTNVIHCAMIVFGLSLVAYIGARQLGGWDMVAEKVDVSLRAAGISRTNWWSVAGLGWLPIIAMFFSATIHTPAASIYVNYSSSARHESDLVPAFLVAGALSALMSMVPVIIGMEALAKYGLGSGISGYDSITRIAMDAGPLVGGIALAAVLAALVSSGGPVLLASATMLVNDWIPGSGSYSQSRKLRAYRVTAVVYGVIAALIAYYMARKSDTASVLQWLLLGFALVVPPAIAIGNIFYVRATTEAATFWGIATGYGLGLLAWLLNKFGHYLQHDITAYVTTLVPLVVIPNLSLAQQVWREHPRRSSLAGRRMAPLLAAVSGGIAGFWYCGGMPGGGLAGVSAYYLAAPLAVACSYLPLATGAERNTVATGLAACLAGWLIEWLLYSPGGALSDFAGFWVALGLPLVVMPTTILLNLKSPFPDERALAFYKRMDTPL